MSTLNNKLNNKFIYTDNLDSKKNHALLVICYCIILSLLFNYFFLVIKLGDQIRNFFIISIITILVFFNLFKRKVEAVKIIKYSSIAFFIFIFCYIGYKLFNRIRTQKFNTLPNLIAAISLGVFIYLIYTFTDFDLIEE